MKFGEKIFEKNFLMFFDSYPKEKKWPFLSKILKQGVKVDSFESLLLIGCLVQSLTNQEPGFKGLDFDRLFKYLCEKGPFFFLLDMNQKTLKSFFQIFFHQISSPTPISRVRDLQA